jgi:hypothetical protein
MHGKNKRKSDCSRWSEMLMFFSFFFYKIGEKEAEQALSGGEGWN